MKYGFVVVMCAIVLAACGSPPDVGPGVEAPEPSGLFVAGEHSASAIGAWGEVTVTMLTDGEHILDVAIHHNEVEDLDEIRDALLITQDIFPLWVFEGSASADAAIAAAEQAFGYALGRYPQEAPAPRFVPGTYIGFMRPYKGGYGEGETRVVMEFGEGEILSVEVDTHMDTGELPTAEDEAALGQAVVQAQSADITPLAHLPMTSHNFALAVDWTIRIAEQGFQYVVVEAEAPSPQPHGLEDGEHFVTVQGRNDELTVGVNVEGGAITRVGIIHRDTPGIVDDAVVELAEAIIARQSPDVDTVTGATNTSAAVLEALDILFNQQQ